MQIGRLHIGRRKLGTRHFKLFYCPLAKFSYQRKKFVFFWWFGKHWFVVLEKRGEQNAQ